MLCVRNVLQKENRHAGPDSAALEACPTGQQKRFELTPERQRPKRFQVTWWPNANTASLLQFRPCQSSRRVIMGVDLSICKESAAAYHFYDNDTVSVMSFCWSSHFVTQFALIVGLLINIFQCSRPKSRSFTRFSSDRTPPDFLLPSPKDHELIDAFRIASRQA